MHSLKGGFAQFMASDLARGLGCLVEFQVRDTVIVSGVAGHKGKLVLDSGCCNEHIKITNNLAGSPQIAANTGKLLYDCIGQVQGGYCSEELLKPNLCLLWVIAVVNAFVDFPDCEDADCNSLFGEGR